MTGKEFLQQNFKNAKALNSKLEQLLGLQDTAYKITTAINKMPTISQKSFSRVESAVINVLQISDEIGNEIIKFLDYRAEVVKTIEQIKELDERLILEYRYLIFKDWREISKIINLSPRQVYNVHRQALKSFDKILDREKLIAVNCSQFHLDK